MAGSNNSHDLSSAIRGGKNPRAQIQTGFRGLLKGAQTAHNAGGSAFTDWMAAQTGFIDSYCDLIMTGISGSQTTAGARTGGGG